MAGEAENQDDLQVENTPLTDAESDALFDAGFGGAEKAPVAKASETTAPEAQAPAPAPVPTPEPPKVKYAKITEEDLQSLLALRTEFSTHRDTAKRNADAMGGKYGELKAAFDRIQAATQAGKPVEITDEDVSDIATLYPDLSKAMLESLKKVAGKFKGTGTAVVTPGPVFDPNMVDQRVQQFLPALTESIKQQVAAETLAELHPDWQTIAGAPGSNTEFRVWLAKQSGDYAKKVLESNNAMTIASAITKFKESKAAPAAPAGKPPASRPGRFADAVQPKGNGAQPVREVEDPFEAAFNKRMAQ